MLHGLGGIQLLPTLSIAFPHSIAAGPFPPFHAYVSVSDRDRSQPAILMVFKVRNGWSLRIVHRPGTQFDVRLVHQFDDK